MGCRPRGDLVMSYALQQVPGQHGQAPGAQGRGEGLGIGHPEGVVVHHLGLLHLEIVPGIGGGGLGVHHHLVGEQDVFGREGGAVVPLDPMAEMKGEGEPVRGDVPALGQVPHLVEVAVIFDQAVVNQGDDAERSGVGGQGRQEGAGVADGAVDEEVAVSRAGVRAAIALLFFFGPTAGDDRGHESRQQQEKKPIPSHQVAALPKEISSPDLKWHRPLACAPRLEACATKISGIPVGAGLKPAPTLRTTDLMGPKADFLLPRRPVLDTFKKSGRGSAW